MGEETQFNLPADKQGSLGRLELPCYVILEDLGSLGEWCGPCLQHRMRAVAYEGFNVVCRLCF